MTRLESDCGCSLLDELHDTRYRTLGFIPAPVLFSIDLPSFELRHAYKAVFLSVLLLQLNIGGAFAGKVDDSVSSNCRRGVRSIAICLNYS